MKPSALATILARMHCPSCSYVATARAMAAAFDALTDHVAHVHGTLAKTA